MFSFPSLVEAAATVGIRVIAELPIPDTPAGNGQGLLWTMEHRDVTEANTVDHFVTEIRRCVCELQM